ncbi:aromatic ring-hydroxylating dioxygenase subunit alpha [Defluviimonas sp. D31]|uniref:aromatic ring-hydroxylating oxygenase subunit alpha n=1 Tax=Defluviimonas sp. D31 TaxID=3083253 RepID=UPI00296EC2D5|nr:aromatic ring-hydroxylating dioxygenase subunit alpha [Defluviimonas sp. D31]MDW4549398.1 aromatic ring-hydroxylating dioxygenase subunit alpha [Defluviimonas sp. D31]
MNQSLKAIPVPNDWDRRGLPGWTYHSEALFDLECSEVLLTHWQIAGHVSDVPGQGDWLAFDFLNERALIVRGKDGVVRAFHNLCRHRGARLVDGEAGQCKSAMVCPFHGWVYNLDGTLRGAARPESFGDMDRAEFGLKPVEMEIWHGFIFLRFRPGPQPSVAELMKPFDADFEAYRAEELLSTEAFGRWTFEPLPVNWKSVRDVDNEGYHVAMAHPALQDLYGRTYRDLVYPGGISHSIGEFGDKPGRLWSVKLYTKFSPEREWLPERLRRSWTYYGIFPNSVIAFTPDGAQYYHDIPLSLNETVVGGRLYRRAHETREERAARYLAYRIDRETSYEDQQLSIWSNESMKSSAFDDFHLSDLEFGVRAHHDRLRALLPVVTLDAAPPEDELAHINEEMRSAGAKTQ